MARYKSCFTLKNILLIVFTIMIMKRFILKEKFIEAHQVGDEECVDDKGNRIYSNPDPKDKVCPGHCDPVHGDMTFFIAGGCRKAPESVTNTGFKYLTKIKGVKKGTQVLNDNIGGLDNKDVSTEKPKTE